MKPGARIRRALAAALLTLAVLPASAAADARTFYTVATYYGAAGGTLPPCVFSAAILNNALNSIPSDALQYAPDIRQAILAALQARAGGACAGNAAQINNVNAIPTGGGGGGPTVVSGPARKEIVRTPPAPAAVRLTADTRPLPLGPVVSATDAGAPAPVIVLGGVAAALGIGLLFALLARLRGWDPAWGRSLRHAFAEAGYRLGALRG
jgi:hypothetical protein